LQRYLFPARSKLEQRRKTGYEEMEGIEQQHLVGSSPKYVSREEEDGLLQTDGAHGSPQLSKPTAQVRKSICRRTKFRRNRLAA
jgi:hypothetical protein